MNFFQAIFLGLVQGITEFLPISSSGHLAIFQKLFNFSSPPIFFDIFIHLGTLVSILVFLRSRLIELIKTKKPYLLLLILVGSLPAVFLGLLLNDQLESIFSSLRLIAFAYLLNSLMLLSIIPVHDLKERFSNFLHRLPFKKSLLGNISFPQALIIGFSQAFALIPGISRSGATISAALNLKIDRQTAFEFSFLLYLPVVLGAALLQFTDLSSIDSQLVFPSLIGGLVAAVSGFFALRILQKTLQSEKLYRFAFYTLPLAAILFLASFF